MENLIEVKEIFENNKKEWNDFVNNSRWGDILQFWEWGDTKRIENWKAVRLAVFKNNKVILQAQCLIKEAGVLGKYIYIPHGPVFHTIEDLKIGIKHLKKALIELARKEEGFVIEIEPKTGKLPDNLLESPICSENIQYLINPAIINLFLNSGFKKTKRNMQPKYKLYYDLDNTEEELLSLMKKNTRYNIKLAKKKGVVINEYKLDDEKTDQKLIQFYDLLLQTQERAKGYPIRSFEYFKTFIKQFKELDNISIFEAQYDNQVICMNISQRTKYWSSSFYASSNRLFTDVKAPYLLRWESIKKAKEYGSKLYDFWGIIPNSNQHKGYSDNKMSFQGVRVDTYGLLSLIISPSRYFIWDKLLPLKSKFAKV